MFCTRCGTTNETNARFCRTCASPLTPTQQQPESAPYPGYQGTSNPGFQQEQPPAWPPTYAQQSYSSAPQRESKRGLASFVMMIVSFFSCGPLLSIPALILGKQEMDAIKRGEISNKDEWMAKAGFYGGIVITLIYCGFGLLYAVVIGLVGVAGVAGQ